MPLPRLLFVSIVAAGFAVACDSQPVSPSLPSDVAAAATVGGGSQAARAGATTRQFAAEVFIDHAAPTHAGPGPHPTTESDQFALTQGGIRWFAGGDVTYWIRGTQPIEGGSDALAEAVATLDGSVTTRTFTRVITPPSVNPCGPSADDILGRNTLWWTPIDGPGGVLGSASVCRDVATKEIVGFVVRFDSDDDWSLTGEAAKFDVLNVGVHELGHVAGLGHVNSSLGGCLTMYKYAAAGETQKQTLGLGDKLGLDFLYTTGDTGAGTCGN